MDYFAEKKVRAGIGRSEEFTGRDLEGHRRRAAERGFSLGWGETPVDHDS